MPYTTLVEIQRTCKLIASTDVNLHLYNLELKGTHPYEHIQEWESIAIYHNGVCYLVVHHDKNLNEIYQPFNYEPETH